MNYKANSLSELDNEKPSIARIVYATGNIELCYEKTCFLPLFTKAQIGLTVTAKARISLTVTATDLSFWGFGVKKTLIGCGRLVNVFFKLFIGFWHVCCLQKFV